MRSDIIHNLTDSAAKFLQLSDTAMIKLTLSNMKSYGKIERVVMSTHTVLPILVFSVVTMDERGFLSTLNEGKQSS